MQPHPVQLIVEDDLRRTRLTVFFRLILAIPHLIWLILWSLLTIVVAILNWIATLVAGRPPAGLHNYMCAYVRYQVHLGAYLTMVGNPYPGFVGEAGEYPVDVRLPERSAQPRWKTLIRIVLAIPALVLSTAFAGSGGFRYSWGKHRTSGSASGGGALSAAVAVLGWFASLALGRMPKGLRDAGAYSLGYSAQTAAYLLLVTDRYPNADPTAMLEGVERPPVHPVHLVGDPHDLRRSRVTVFFRIPLAIPHVVWIVLWSIAALFAVIANWFVTLFRGTPAEPLHRFLSRFVRYELHLGAYVYLTANPFPGFTGQEGTYPLDLVLPGPTRQNRWRTGFRLPLAIPAAAVSGALGGALLATAVLTWFAALVTGSAPYGLRNLAAYALRYQAQLNAYLGLLTEEYPHASPLEGGEPDAASGMAAEPVEPEALAAAG